MKTLKKMLVFLACLYTSLVLLSVAIFHLPWWVLELFPEAKRDQIISSGIVSATVHPLYRDWLLNFVRTPNAPRDTDYIMDTYRAFGEALHTTVDDDASDFLGWPNTIRPHDAQVLFVGDSFCNGSSVGTRLSPPAVYAKLTGARVYNASNPGYGLDQYVRIIDKLTAGLPQDERFAGKDVVVLVHLGNDFTADIMQHKIRLKYSEDQFSWQLQLGPLHSWIQYLLSCFGLRPAFAAPSGVYSPVPMTCETQGDLPFAWHPGYAGYLIPGIFTAQLPMARQLIDGLKSLEARGLSIKIVLVPTSLQVVVNDIDWSKVGIENRLAQDIPRMTEMLEEIRTVSTELFRRADFEVLDMTDILRASPQRCLYFQPADTHCTARGYEAIGQAIASRWPELGRTHAN